MKCVVTGASGHIGNVLVRDLINKKYEVKAFVLKNEKCWLFKKVKCGNLLWRCARFRKFKKCF